MNDENNIPTRLTIDNFNDFVPRWERAILNEQVWRFDRNLEEQIRELQELNIPITVTEAEFEEALREETPPEPLIRNETRNEFHRRIYQLPNEEEEIKID